MIRILTFIKNLIIAFLLYLASFIIVFVFMMLVPVRAVYFLGIYLWTPVIFFILGNKLKVSGRENLEEGKYYIFMANHSSWSDIPAAFGATRRGLHFIAKQELSSHFILGPIMRKMQMVFIDRSNPRKSAASMKIAIERIKQGCDIMIFPEGTRTRTGEMNRFKRGGFKLAAESKVEIVPLGISGSAHAWGVDNITFHRGTITVNIGRPIPTTDCATDEDINRLSDKVKTEIEKLIDKTPIEK